MKLHTSKPWFLLSAILLLAALSFTSCSKEDEVMNLDNIGSQLPGNMIKYVDKYQEAYEYDKEDEEICFGGARIKSNIYDKEKGYGIITFWDDVKEVSGFGGNPVSIVLPEGVVSIGDDAFLYSDDLSSITLPKSLREIGFRAFEGSSDLTNITIPNSVESIGSRAFRGCESLKTITLPTGINTIPAELLNGCTSLTDITIPSSVTSIEMNAFGGCSSLSRITIPSSVTSIVEDAFAVCSALESIVVAEGNSSYDSRDNCNAIIEKSSNTLVAGCRNTSIPSSVEHLGNYAFYGAGIKSIVLPDSLISIGERAFFDCDNLKSITMGKGMPPKCDDPFSNSTYTNATLFVPAGFKETYKQVEPWGKFVNIVEEESYIDIGECGAEGNNVTWKFNPMTGHLIIEGKGAMADYAYYSSPSPFMEFKEDIVSVEIKEGVTSVGMDMFYFCSNLKSVEIQESVITLGIGAFEGCSSLTNVKLPNSLTNIGNRCFMYCKSIAKIVIPNMVSTIGSQVFHDCVGLTNITLPNSVKEIGNLVFYGCSNLSNILLPSSLTSIGFRAFEGCSSLTNITIPSSVASIGSWAFSGCSNLTFIEMENSTPPSVEGAYHLDLSDKTEVIVPAGSLDAYKSADGWKDIVNISPLGECGAKGNNVTWKFNSYIGYLVIEGEGKMKDYGILGFEDNLSPFFYYSLIKKVEIKDGVTSLGSCVFYDCTNLSDVTLPLTLTSIGSWAFAGCENLASITIPGFVTSIESSAFYNCNLTEVICNALTPPNASIESSPFGADHYKSATLKVPSSAKSLYETTEPWSEFKHIVGF